MEFKLDTKTHPKIKLFKGVFDTFIQIVLPLMVFQFLPL